MSDLIDRQAVLEKQYRIDDSATLSTRDVVNVDDIEDLPSVTPQPKTGHWIQKPKHEVTEWTGLDNFTKVVICSECGEWKDHKSRYCPSCGAKMVDPQESEG